MPYRIAAADSVIVLVTPRYRDIAQCASSSSFGKIELRIALSVDRRIRVWDLVGDDDQHELAIECQRPPYKPVLASKSLMFAPLNQAVRMPGETSRTGDQASNARSERL